jgi:hypothetical protein
MHAIQLDSREVAKDLRIRPWLVGSSYGVDRYNDEAVDSAR